MNVDKFVAANNLQEITNPILLNRGYVPSPDGLLSVEIFGSTMAKRKNTFAFINLKGHFFQPLAYSTVKKVFSKLDSLIAGQTYWSITKEGELVEDPRNGETGIDWLYQNWDKIKFKRNESKLRNEKITFLELYKKDEIFMSKQIVCPPFYRDINLQNKDAKKPSVHQINGPYSKVIRLASMLDQGNFALALHGTRLNIQKEIENIYLYFKGRTEKKSGLIRQAVLGKSDDYCSRVVIATPQFKSESVDDMLIDFYHSGLPLSHTISTFTPFFVGWIQNKLVEECNLAEYKFEYTDDKGRTKWARIKDPRLQFNDEVINKMMNKYIFNYTNRFDPIEVEFYNGAKRNLRFRGIDPTTGKVHHEFLTLTDLFYMAAVDITADKHVYITRYPIADHLGIFPNRIRVLSTNKTMKMMIDEREYTHYPIVDLNMKPDDVATQFIEVLQMSNTYLLANGGDYDGDQITVKSVFSQEANIEAEQKMRAVSNFLSVNGNNIRTTTNEAVLTLFMMTRW